MLKIKCERLECELSAVAAYCKLWMPNWNSLKASRAEETEYELKFLI